MLCSFSMTSKIYQVPCSQEKYWKKLLNVTFGVDTDCYIMKTSSKSGKIENCKKFNSVRKNYSVYDDQNDDNNIVSVPTMKEIYKNTYIVIQNLLFQRSTENFSINVNSPMVLSNNVRLFA